ncbi:MAG: PHP domain-containing protein [Balneolaceae bacterium]
MSKADLHTHTTYSDGACDPIHLVKLAAEKGLAILAITDHDTIEGYLKIRDSAEQSGLELISGVELTTRFEKYEIHILAYCFDSTNKHLLDILRNQRRARLKRMHRILDILSKKGLKVEIDEVISEARGNNVGRPHLASVLVKKNYVGSVQEAFIRYLSSTMLGDVETDYISIAECIKLVSDAGGITSLAHPGVIGNLDVVDKILALGIDGIECIHPSHNFEKQKMFSEIAESKNLLVTGGSDFHGTGREYDPYFGIVTLSEKKVISLKRMSKRRKEAVI